MDHLAKAHPTILSGAIKNPDDSLDNTYHVITIPSNSTGSMLDGVIIENGYVNGELNDDSLGAGILCYGQTTINNCIIRNSSSQTGGAGIYVSGINAILKVMDSQIYNCSKINGPLLHDTGGILYLDENTSIEK